MSHRSDFSPKVGSKRRLCSVLQFLDLLYRVPRWRVTANIWVDPDVSIVPFIRIIADEIYKFVPFQFCFDDTIHSTIHGFHDLPKHRKRREIKSGTR
jgi:hypothetical protein